MNLNDVAPPARKRGDFDWEARQRGATVGKVTVHFGDVASNLEAFLRDSESVVGCVAWFSSPRMVAALENKPVAFIVNKEFFLRSTDNAATSKRKRETLSKLSGGLHTREFPAPLRALDMPLDAVRCFGQAGGKYAPFMHSKFIVRLRKGKPVAVWTGSFNLTAGAEFNVENGIEIEDAVIARAYFEEFARIAALSEPMEFRTGAPAPQSTPRPVKPSPLTTHVVKGRKRSAAKAPATKRTPVARAKKASRAKK